VAVNFVGEGNHSIQRKPAAWHKILTSLSYIDVSSTGYQSSSACIKRSPWGQKETVAFKTGDLLIEDHSYEIFYDRIRKMLPINTGDCLIEDRFDCTIIH